MKHNIHEVTQHFQTAGDFVSGAPYGSGHINDTYAVVFRAGSGTVRYILQRVNHKIFKNVPSLMNNISLVTNWSRKFLHSYGADDIERRVLTLVPATDGSTYHIDDTGNYWRMYNFIEGARTYDAPENATQAYEAAKAFGAFQMQLADMQSGEIVETIPGFHDTRARFVALEAAIDRDECNRAVSVKNEIEFAFSRENIVDRLLDLNRDGLIPLRITHNDTKINNVMLDNNTSEGICVIDLDTIMPGLSLYDFGDCVRTTAFRSAEDERDLSKVKIDMDLFAAVARGYISATDGMLNETERQNLVFAARLITFEIGIRFLADYLEGDIYFKTHREAHNLDRCRTQFARTSGIESRLDAMEKIVAGI